MYVRRRPHLVAIAILCAFGALASTGAFGSASAARPAMLYVAPDGSGGTCSKARPCSSFAVAYRRARPGQIVQVAGGTYPQQVIGAEGSKTSSQDVIFRTAPGAVATIGCDGDGASCMDISASHITFDGGRNKGFRSQTYNSGGFSYQGRVDTERGATDITFRNINVGAVAIGSSYTNVIHSDLGPSTDPYNIMLAEEADHLLFQGNLIHDFVITRGGHFECMYWDGPDWVTMRDNEFRSCAIFGVHAKENPHYHELIENNVFWNPRGLTNNADLQFTNEANPCGDVIIRYNDFTDGVWDDCWPTHVYGNLFRDNTDLRARGWDHNLRVRDGAFVDAVHGNFHLRRGSVAIGRGAPTDFPRRDKDGRLRPKGKRPDVGAYEYEPQASKR